MTMLNQSNTPVSNRIEPAQLKMSDLTTEICNSISGIYERINTIHSTLSKITNINNELSNSCKPHIQNSSQTLHEFLELLYQDTIRINNIFDNIHDQLSYKI